MAVQQNIFSTHATCTTIRSIDNNGKKATNADVSFLSSQASAIQAKSQEILLLRGEAKTKAKENFALKVYPIVQDAKLLINNLDKQTLANRDKVESALNQIIDSFTLIQFGASLSLDSSIIIDGEEEEFTNICPKSDDGIEEPAKWLVSHADSHKASLKNVEYNAALKAVVIPAKVVDESISDRLVGKYAKNDEIADEALKQPITEKNAPDFKRHSEHAKTWKAVTYRKVGNNLVATDGKVYPTTHPLRRTLKIPHELTNIHYQKINGQLCITSGVINSPEKTDEILATIRKENGDAPPKVLICQLNSFLKETALVEDEHAAAIHLDKALSKDGAHSVAHLNHCLSGFSQLPLVEDASSYTQNLLGLGVLAQWTGLSDPACDSAINDVENLRKKSFKKIKIINDLNAKLNKTFNCGGCSSEASNDANMTDAERKQTKLRLKQLNKELKTLQGNLKKAEATLKTQLETVRVACNTKATTETDVKSRMVFNVLSKLIAQETYSKASEGLDRVTEIELILLLSVLLKDQNVVIILNCKSGIDRTGLAKAIWEGMQEMLGKFADERLSEDEAFTRLFDLIANMQADNETIDLIVKGIIDNRQGVVVTKPGDFETAPDGSQVIQDINRALEEHANPRLKYAWMYKQRITESLLSVGLSATIESTILPGLKYNYKTETDSTLIGILKTAFSNAGSNPHPLKRWAPVIITDDNKVVQLYHKLPVINRPFPTEIGDIIILRNSKKRGD